MICSMDRAEGTPAPRGRAPDGHLMTLQPGGSGAHALHQGQQILTREVQFVKNSRKTLKGSPGSTGAISPLLFLLLLNFLLLFYI